MNRHVNHTQHCHASTRLLHVRTNFGSWNVLSSKKIFCEYPLIPCVDGHGYPTIIIQKVA